MKRSLVLTVIASVALAGLPAAAQDLAVYNKALSAYNANQFEDSARLFFEVTNSTTDNDLRLKADYYLASSFQRANMPFTAFVYFTTIVKAGPQHPYHLKAVEALIALQEVLNDDFFIPNIFNIHYDKYADAWATLPLEVLARINYLIGRISHRKGKLEEAKQFLEAVPDTSQFYAKAQYMVGIALVDPRFPAADENARTKNVENAISTFENVLKIKTRQLDFEDTKQLSYLALGRANYNVGQFQKSTEWYEKVPRFSKYWDQSLFENGFARFQNDDLGGALGSLQGLYAPQFAGAFQPESWILTSTTYYFSCLYDESKASLLEYEKLYLPMAEKLKLLVDSGTPRDVTDYFKLVNVTESEQVPKAVLNWVRTNERMLGVLGLLKQIDVEKQMLENNQSWKAAKMSGEVTTYLDQNRATAEQVAGQIAKGRLTEAYRTIKGFGDQVEIIRFEIAKAEKELAESGVDTGKVLGGQTLYRPQMPAENWNYWKFEGEFWRDEIGYYQYTLKRGCPAN
ncbi:MAG: tetratricopeptide repeat protein [Myxococcaceae bacterium]